MHKNSVVRKHITSNFVMRTSYLVELTINEVAQTSYKVEQTAFNKVNTMPYYIDIIKYNLQNDVVSTQYNV